MDPFRYENERTETRYADISRAASYNCWFYKRVIIQDYIFWPLSVVVKDF